MYEEKKYIKKVLGSSQISTRARELGSVFAASNGAQTRVPRCFLLEETLPLSTVSQKDVLW